MGFQRMLALVAFCVSSLVLGEDIEVERIADSSLCSLSRSSAPKNLPLLFNGTGKIYPSFGNGGNIYIDNGAKFNASCSPTTALLKEFKVNQLTLQCRDGSLSVYPDGRPTTFGNLGCEDGLKEDVDEQTNGNCYADAKNISIEFNTSLKKFPLITLCHDYGMYNTLMARHFIYGNSMSVAEISNARPSFKKAQFYSSVSVQNAYSQANQKEIVQSLVNSDSLGSKYIDPSKSFYFARGHLSPDGDFIYVSEQNATYYYVNVIPQWQAINNGNWKMMEGAVRKLAQNHSSTLEIYTGGYGVLKLKDVNENRVGIYLAREPSGQLVIPAPELTWKIIHEPSTKSAVVIIMVNNPHEEVQPEQIICPNQCDKVAFVTWDTTNYQKGSTYCCDLTSFRKVVKYAPSLGRVKLLTK